jgi:ATP-binding cassette subfamily B protein
MLFDCCPIPAALLVLAVVLQAWLPYGRWQALGRVLDGVRAHLPSQVIMWQWLGFAAYVVLVMLVDLAVKKLCFTNDQSFKQSFAPYIALCRLRYGMTSHQRGTALQKAMQLADRGDYSSRFVVIGQFTLIGSLLNIAVGLGLLLWHVARSAGLSPWQALLFGAVLTAAVLATLWVEMRCAVRLALTERAHWGDMAEITTIKGNFNTKEKMKCILLFGIAEPLVERIRSLAQKMCRPLMRLSWRMLPWEAAAALILAAAFAWTGWQLLSSTLAGNLSQGEFVFLLTTMLTVSLGMKRVVETAAQQALGADQLVDLFRFMGSPPEDVDIAPDGSEALPPADVHAVEVQELTFAYELGKPVLERVSALFPAGETTYIPGNNGAGKTTLVNAISRLFANRTASGETKSSGRILIGGVDAERLMYSELQKGVKHLGQDSLEIRFTPRELLGYAAGCHKPEECPEDWMWQALKMACLDDKVRSLPRKLDEPMAVFRSAEEDLSGGQRRKLNIAMLFMGILAGKLQVIILDEPFVGVEPRHAKRIMQNFRKLGKTLIIITHDVDKLKPSARVVFLHREEGAAGNNGNGVTKVFQGTHGALLEECPEYRAYCAVDGEDSDE